MCARTQYRAAAGDSESEIVIIINTVQLGHKGVSPMVLDHPRWSPTTRQNLFMCDPPL